MKRLFFFVFCAAAVVAAGCSDDVEESAPKQVVVDFEGGEWISKVASISSSFDFMTEDYVWEDALTSLTSRPMFATSEWGSYYGGGCTVSNYGSGNLAAQGSYEYDLYVYKAATEASRAGCGANGSDNFLVFYDNMASIASVVGADLRPEIFFRDGEPRTIKSCKINSTTYFVNIVENGNAFSPKLKEGEEIKVYATGFDSMGNKTTTTSISLATYGSTVKEWTTWDLTALGEVVKVQFYILGGPTDDYGMTTPKYFALDDIVVEWTK